MIFKFFPSSLYSLLDSLYLPLFLSLRCASDNSPKKSLFPRVSINHIPIFQIFSHIWAFAAKYVNPLVGILLLKSGGNGTLRIHIKRVSSVVNGRGVEVTRVMLPIVFVFIREKVSFEGLVIVPFASLSRSIAKAKEVRFLFKKRYRLKINPWNYTFV